MKTRSLLIALLMLAIGPLAGAATVIARPDEAMIARADGVVLGSAVEAFSRVGERGLIETVYRLRVEESLKGQFAAGEIVEVVEYGGRVGDAELVMSGAPRYGVGSRYLVFLSHEDSMRWATFDLGFGQFASSVDAKGNHIFERADGASETIKQDGTEFVDRPRLEAPFLQFVRDISRGTTADGRYFVDGTGSAKVTAPGSSPEVTPRVLDLDLAGASNIAMSQWSSAGSIGYTVSGTNAGGNAIGNDGEDRIIPDDPNNVVSGSCCPGVVGTAFYGCNPCAQHMVNGETYRAIDYADVVVNNGVSSANLGQSNLNTTITHEVGHTLGYRHSNVNADNAACALPLPCSGSAVMNSSVIGGLNGVLQTWDLQGANEVYGDGSATTFLGSQYVITLLSTPARRQNSSVAWRILSSVCTPVSISAQPQSSSISSGTSKTLSVTAAGSGPFTYRWYRGNSGDTSTPVGTNSASFNTGTLNTTTSYWVRITNCSGANTVNSNTATVTVTCSASIMQQPQSVSIPSGTGTTLSVVVAAGGTYAYQWYRGNSPGTADPVTGATSSSINTGALTQSVSFWARVTRTDCDPDSVANSATATVSICTPVAIANEPQDATVISGTGTTLSVTASGSGTKTYQWYRGVSGNTTNKLTGKTTSSLATGNLTSTTQFWVRVGNTCGGSKTADSRTATVTVQASCVQPLITVQPQSKTINEGESTTLTVTATGTSLGYQWYVGTSGNTAQPVGSNSASFDTGTLAQTKSYWVRISNGCGQANSTAATVTVQPSCPAGALCALGGRFQLSLAVRDHRTGKTGTGMPLAQNDIFGFYSLPTFTGDPNNPEVFVKMLDGRSVNGNFWTFFGGLTDLEYTLTVKDTQTGGTKIYSKAGGTSNGGFDVGAGVTPETCAGEVDGTPLTTEAPTVCAAGTDRLCLSNSRFRVTLTARDQRTGVTGAGQSIPQNALFGDFSIPALTGNPTNPEVFVKLVDARGFNGFYWVFFSGLTDFEYTITVTDTFTGKKKSYEKLPGSACGAFDTNAFTGN
ncbi:MAG: hypothetical protein WC538_02525 [Thermoanaerobaculia bacterium]|jgi:hypothetical protein